MWCLQEIARLTDYQFSYQEMAEQAASVHAFLQEIDLNHDRFNKPKNMIEEIQAACRESGHPIPKTVGELVMCVYSNLARIYAREFKQLEDLSGKTIDYLHIVGAGLTWACSIS